MITELQIAERFPGTSQADRTFLNNAASFAKAEAAALANVDAAVVMKVGRHLADIRDAADAVGLAAQAVYVERASCATERVLPLTDTAEIEAPYFSLVLIPGTGLDARSRPVP